MNLLHPLYVLTIITLVALWANVFVKSKWLSTTLLVSLSALIAYIPLLLTNIISAMNYNFTTTFQTLKYLLDNMGIGS